MTRKKRASSKAAAPADEGQAPQAAAEPVAADSVADQNSPTGDAEAVAADPVPALDRVAEPKPAAKPVKPRQRLGGLALLLALIALGLSGWLLYERLAVPPSTAVSAPDDGPDLADFKALESRLDSLAAQWSEMAEQLDALSAAQGQAGSQIEQSVEQQAGRLGSLEQQLQDGSARSDARAAELADRLDDLAGRLQQAVDNMAERGDFERQAERELQRQVGMLEAASLLTLGQNRAELAGDIHGAQAAFRRAAAQLAAIDDARLDRSRQALARELEALQALRRPDLSQSLARLERLGRDARLWPVQLDRRETALASADPDPETEDIPWRERVSGVARGLVRVQARDELGRTSEQFDTARELVQLRLVAAQLALVRQDEEAYRLHLRATDELLDEWFDPAAEPVRQARSDLQELAELSLDTSLPELGEALHLLRQRLGDT